MGSRRGSETGHGGPLGSRDFQQLTFQGLLKGLLKEVHWASVHTGGPDPRVFGQEWAL